MEEVGNWGPSGTCSLALGDARWWVWGCELVLQYRLGCPGKNWNLKSKLRGTM